MSKRILGAAIATVGLVALAVPSGYAASAPLSTAHVGGAVTPLAGCAVTFAPKVGSTAGRICLVPENAAMRAAAVKPDAGGCAFDYYQNGPYGSTAWADGWAACVVDNSGGDYYVPTSLNDQASSWDSCSAGIFYGNQPGTSPSASFPANSSGNFPRGAVGNDSLSSAYVDANDC